MSRWLLLLLVKLYPAAWRQRYAAEYLALLEEAAPLAWRDGLDIVRGVADAHLHPEWLEPGRWPMNRRRVFRIAGVGAILSTVLLALGLLNSQRLPEAEAEFLVLMSPLALLPLAVALHTLFRAFAPRASRLTAVVGLLSLSLYFLATIVGAVTSWLVRPLTIPLAWVVWLYQGMIALVGVWLLLAAYLGWRTRTLPVAVPGLMLAAGLSWLMMFAGLMLTSRGNAYLGAPLATVLGLSLFVWMITHAVWTVWLGVWLWLQEGGAETAVAP